MDDSADCAFCRSVVYGASRTLNDQIGTEDSHAAHTDTGLGGTVGSTKAGEDDGGRAAQRTEEGLYHG